MNFEINDYDSGHELFENINLYENNNRVNEQEYEFQNNYNIFTNNINSFIPPIHLSNEISQNKNDFHDSFINMSNNISPNEELNNNNYNSKSNEDENFIPSPLNNFNNYKSNYLKETNSINLLNLTDKIYESDEHFRKGIISKKNENTDKNLKMKKSYKGTVNKRNNRKSLFITNSNNLKKINNIDGKKSINTRKRRESFMIKNRDKNNLGNLYKLKQRKNSIEIMNHETEKNNNDTYNEENKKNKNKKIIHYQTIKEKSFPKGSQIHITKYKNNNKIVKNNKKNKLSEGELDNDKKEEKIIIREPNNKPDKNNSEKISNINNEINEKTQNIVKDIKEEKNEKEINKKDNKDKNKHKFCLFCCLNSKIDDS